MKHVPYWSLSGFYFFYFAYVGALTPYWGLYLQSLHFTALEIGVLMSLLQVMRIFAPNLWGWLADHTGRRTPVIQLTAGLSLLCYAGVFFGESFAWLFAVMAAMSFFWSASLPLVEATTLSHLGERTARYTHIRLWGSVGFILAVVGLGYALDAFPLRFLLWAVLAILLGLLLASRVVPEAPVVPHHTDDQPVWLILRRPEVLAFLGAGFLMHAAHGVYYTFYSIHLVAAGYSKALVGQLWALGVACEIALFLAMPRLAERFSLRMLMLVSVAAAALRFLVIGWGVGSLPLLLAAQTLHAVTFGAYHVAAVSWVHHFFRGRHQAKGQAFYNSLAFGAGGAVGGLMSGAAWDTLGSAWTFTLAALCALAGWVLVVWKVRENRDL